MLLDMEYRLNMVTSVRYVSATPLERLGIYRGSPYEHESTAPVGQTIVVVKPLPLVICGAIVRNPYTTVPAPLPSIEKAKPS